MRLDPLKATAEIRSNYLRYLTTTFPLQDVELGCQFTNLLQEEHRLTKGPILEVTPPYQNGKCLEELVLEGVLSSGFRELCSEYLPLNRPLYRHQEQASRKLIVQRRNVVVATGTGSGKTETFLIPIFHHLLNELERGQLQSGIRALLLYPMNALANDQVKRLRRIFKNFPAITFGRYTGETKETTKEAEEHFLKNFPDEPRIPNEILSREEMRQAPPHIFLTNYAMLEYLLLRPKDCEFFDGEKSGFWKFIVLDEAHTYDGAKGIETAMLLRRLKDRLVKSEAGLLQCIATSATLGRGREDFPKIVRFAGQLFGEKFEWDAAEEDRQDVVEATRIAFSTDAPSCYSLPAAFYSPLRDMVAERDWTVEDMLLLGRQYGISDDILSRIQVNSREHYSDKIQEGSLFELLKGDTTVQKLRKVLEDEPCFLHEITQHLFPSLPGNEAQRELTALVDLCVQTKADEQSLPLLPTRYHLFVRALEGAYLFYAPGPTMLLDRKRSEEIDGESYAVFELAICRRCGIVYFSGRESDDGYLEQAEGYRDVEFYLFKSGPQAAVPDDDDQCVLSGEEDVESQHVHYHLCPRCGKIQRVDAARSVCSCFDDEQEYLAVQKVKAKEGVVRYCPACGSRTSGSSLVRRFFTGQDAPVTVLATALYQHAPDKILEAPGTLQVDDEWGALSSQQAIQAEQDDTNRQLLLFSDSRQDAAFFACFLDRTYQQILRRRLIVHTLEKYSEDALRNRWRVQDLVVPLRLETQRLGVFEAGLSPQQQERIVWKWLLKELLAFGRRNSLEGLGLLGFTLVLPESWQAPKPLLNPPWSLTEDEIRALYQVLLDSFRLQSALTFPDSVDPKDEEFQPRNYAFYFRKQGANSRRHIFSWGNPGKGRLNRRLDFLMKLAKSCSSDLRFEDCHTMLNNIWTRGLIPGTSSSCWKDTFESSTLRHEGTVYRLRHEFWELQPGCISSDAIWHQCDTCGNLFLQNVRGICPTYRCEGRLQRCQPDEIFSANHYWNLYTSVVPSRMVCEEHTAQLTSEAAAELQERFIKGDVNVLSCSTTFELGVDVGDLETVLMRNVPPSPANYIQRAGRAGRRTDSAAFAVTFCQRRSHDLSHFHEPKRMVSGKIQAPFFELENEKIIRRHVYAVALAQFWKRHSQYFGKVKDFFFPKEDSGISSFEAFLNRMPQNLADALSRIVPQDLQSVLHINDWMWREALLGESGVLSRAAQEIQEDIESLERVYESLSQKRQPADYLLRTMNTLQRKDLIGYLSSRNVLPKYGFPVDLVELQLLHHGPAARRLELSRDLRIAISEYAPESEVIAGGHIWVSYGLKRLQKHKWLEYDYVICPSCEHYQKVLKDTRKALKHCRSCGSPLNKKGAKGTFLIPEFGFITDSTRMPKRPGESRPVRSYSSRAFFSEDDLRPAGTHRILELGRYSLKAMPYNEGLLTMLNRTGFKICSVCGFALRSGSGTKTPALHKTSWGTECIHRLSAPKALGHEFRTDVVNLRFDRLSKQNESFRYSLLYAMLEGMSESLAISRNDIDGCLFNDKYGQQAFILYDTVPGGAGHVKRLTNDIENLHTMLSAALSQVSGQCGCGEDSSCYGCLRNYHNQFCHEQLLRGSVKDFLESLSF